MFTFALIGCGRIGTRHAELIAKIGKLAAVCDTDAARCDLLARKYGAAPFNSLDDLLQASPEIKIICICTPNGMHAEHCIKSLQNGRDVLCEKPLCLTTSAAWSIMDTAHFFRRKVYIVKQNRFNEAVVFAKKLLTENAMGRILSFEINCFWNRPAEYYDGSWRGTVDNDGGLLYTQFSHFIDLLYWFLGDVVFVQGIKINNQLRNHLQIEDTGAVLLQMKNGATGSINYTINSYENNKEGSFTIFGESGTVKIGGEYLNSIEWVHTRDGSNFQGSVRPKPNDYGFYTGSMSNHHLVYDELVKALQGEPHQLPQLADAVKTVEIIEKIYAHSTDLSPV